MHRSSADSGARGAEDDDDRLDSRAELLTPRFRLSKGHTPRTPLTAQRSPRSLAAGQGRALSRTPAWRPCRSSVTALSEARKPPVLRVSRSLSRVAYAFPPGRLSAPPRPRPPGSHPYRRARPSTLAVSFHAATGGLSA